MKITKQHVYDVVVSAGYNGISSQDIGKKLSVEAKTTLYRTKQLCDEGKIRMVRDGVSVIYKAQKVASALAPAEPKVVMPEPVAYVPDEKPAVPNVSIDVVLDKMLDKMVNTLADSVMARIKVRVRERMHETLAEVTADIEKYRVPIEKAKLRRIFIGGAIPKQVQELKKEFEGVCELVFAGSDESAQVWQARARDAYASILWTDFVSHKHSEYLQSAGVKPVLYTGGITLLKDKIMELCI